MKNYLKAPIGIFDSGVGGLSIARHIQHALPRENLVYVADQKFSPYGSKSNREIEQRSASVVAFLAKQGCKAIVVACNTATLNAIESLRANSDLPIIGVEPGIKPAVEQSKTGIIAVLATELTLNSAPFKALKARFEHTATIETQACPRFVALVEQGNINNDEATHAVEDYVLPLLDKGADHIVLGCTHYSFLSPAIKRVVNDRAKIVDTVEPVVAELKRQLIKRDLINTDESNGLIEFWSSDDSVKASETISRLWGATVPVTDFSR